MGDLNPSGSGLTYRWEYSFSGAPFTTVVNGSNVPVSTSKLSKSDITNFVLAPNLDASGDYSLRRIVSSGTCSNTSPAVFLYYSQNISRISGGAVSNQEKCSPASGSLIVTGNTGPVLRWESAPAGTQNWTLLDSTRNSLSYNNLTQSTCYRALIDNICTGTPGVIDASDIYSTPGCVTVNSVPLISVHPASQTVCQGASLTLSVTATSVLAPTYQWRKAGVAIAGAVSATFTIANVTSTNAGSYDVVVSNACGSVTSNSAAVTVNPLPIVTIPANSTVCPGATISSTNFTSTPSDATYTWTNSKTTIGLAAGGTGNVPGFTAVNNTTSAITATITIVPVLNGCTGPPSSYTIKVNPTATVTVPANFTVCSGATVPSSNFSSVPPGATITWTSSNPDIGLAATSGTKNVPSFTATNTTTSAISATITVTPTANGCTGTASSYSITVNPLPVITSAIPKSETGCGEGDGKITITATGTEPLEYSINGGSTFQNGGNFTELAAGSYTVAVRNANGCLVVGQTVTVTSPGAPPAPEVDEYQYPVCEGQNLVLTVKNYNPSFVYTWTGPSQFSGSGQTVTISNVSPSMAGSYAVTATSGACVGLPNVFNVAVSPLPVVTVPPNLTFCAGATIPEGVFISTPAGAIYTWTNSKPEIGLDASGSSDIPAFTATNNTAQPITATITVTPSLNGCTGLSKSYTITVNPLPALFTVTGGGVYCAGGSGVAIGLDGSQIGVNYQLKNGGTDVGSVVAGMGLAISFGLKTAAGTYTVVATNVATTCSARMTDNVMVTINQPAAITSSASVTTAVVCYGGTGTVTIIATGGTTPLSYTFNGTINTTGIFTGVLAGTKTYSITDFNNCNAVTGTIIVTQPAAKLAASVTLQNNISCYSASDGKIDITITGGTAPYTYAWSNGKTTEDISGLAANLYTVVVTDAKNCSITETIIITQPTSALSISVTKTDIYCSGGNNGTVSLKVNGGTAPFTYIWSNGANTSELKGLTPGNYIVNVFDANGCSVSQSVVISQLSAQINASLTIKNTICKTSNDGMINALITGGTQPYAISLNGLPQNTNAMSNLAPGMYELLITDANGCTFPISAEVMAGNCPPVAVDDRFSTDEEVQVSGSVALNDFDRQNEAISFTMTSQVKNGRIIFTDDGKFTYTPNVGFWGTETITYQVCNTSGLCAPATIAIDVIPYTIVSLTPDISNVREGKKVLVTARLMRPFKDDVIIRISYTGRALKDRDYVLLDQFYEISIPKGKVSTSEKITIAALTDDQQEGDEDVILQISASSDPLVRIGNGAKVIINDVYPPPPSPPGPVNSAIPPNPDILPDPLISPNGDGQGNEFFNIENIVSFPDNEVLIFNRWGNEVFRLKGYNESDRVFKGYANTGLLTNQNTPLVDGVYYYLITTNRIISGKNILALNKGYLILKR